MRGFWLTSVVRVRLAPPSSARLSMVWHLDALLLKVGDALLSSSGRGIELASGCGRLLRSFGFLRCLAHVVGARQPCSSKQPWFLGQVV